MIAQGEQVHITTWPAKAPMRRILPGTLNANGVPAIKRGGPGNYDNLAANRTRTVAHCFEGKCFGVLYSGFMSRQMIDELTAGALDASKDLVAATMEHSAQAETRFLDPTGAPMDGFVIDAETGEKKVTDTLRFEEGILYADLDIEKTVEGKTVPRRCRWILAIRRL